MSDRIADALERIADALERAHPKFNPGGYVGGDYTLPELPSCGYGRVVTRDAIRAALDAKPCDDRTCTDRDHWAPRGRINHGSTPTTCVHGQDHLDDLECEYHDEPLQVGEFQVSSLETGKPVRVTVTSRKTGATLFDGDLAKLPADLDLPQGGWSADDLVQPMADPLDESDHRPRHDRDGEHVYRHGERHWHSYGLEDGACDMKIAMDDPVTLAHYNDHSGPLTFCDCDTTEAENGATD